MRGLQKDWRLRLSGVMTGAFLPLLFLAFVLGELWARAHPAAVGGFVFRHKGLTTIGYLSQFESTSFALALILAPIIFLIGVQLTPKRNVRTRSLSYWYDEDDPRNLLPKWRLLGAVLALGAAFVVGPVFVRTLNSWGVTLSIG